MLFVVVKYGPKPSTKHQRQGAGSEGSIRAKATAERRSRRSGLKTSLPSASASRRWKRIAPRFQRTMRGLNILFDGLQQQTGLTGCSAQTELIGFIRYFVSAGK